MRYDAPLRKAILKAGGVTKLAAHLGIVPSAIPQWKRLPARHARSVSELTGIPRHELRPDLWEPPGEVPADVA